jgi:hypothetical protein
MQSAKLLAYQLGATGNPISNKELISSILDGLNSTAAPQHMHVLMHACGRTYPGKFERRALLHHKR